MDHLEELLDLERAGWQSLCDGTGGAFYRAHMTPDGAMVLAHGAVLDRDGVAASLDGAPPWAGYEILDPLLVELGGEAGRSSTRGGPGGTTDPGSSGR